MLLLPGELGKSMHEQLREHMKGFWYVLIDRKTLFHVTHIFNYVYIFFICKSHWLLKFCDWLNLFSAKAFVTLW